MILAFTLTFQADNALLNLPMARLFIFFIAGSLSGFLYLISSQPGNKNTWCSFVRRDCFISGIFHSFASLTVAVARRMQPI